LLDEISLRPDAPIPVIWNSVSVGSKTPTFRRSGRLLLARRIDTGCTTASVLSPSLRARGLPDSATVLASRSNAGASDTSIEVICLVTPIHLCAFRMGTGSHCSNCLINSSIDFLFAVLSGFRACRRKTIVYLLEPGRPVDDRMATVRVQVRHSSHYANLHKCSAVPSKPLIDPAPQRLVTVMQVYDWKESGA
jgi:hypothetical protein